MTKDIGDPDFEQLATPAEILSGWKALTVADRKKLAAYAETLARMYQFADPGMTREDLLQTAYTLVLGDKRAWKLRQITFLAYMFGVLRSVASDLKRTNAGRVRAHSDPEGLDEERQEFEERVDRDDPEATLIARQEQERTRALIESLQYEFKDDQDAFLVLECLLEGKKPREVRETLNMEQKDYDAVRNRIARRTIKLLRPN